MDRLMELTEYMVKRIKSMPDKFYLILEPELVNVSFWYVPTRLRSMPHGPEREKLLGQVSKRDYFNFIRESSASIGHLSIETLLCISSL